MLLSKPLCCLLRVDPWYAVSARRMSCSACLLFACVCFACMCFRIACFFVCMLVCFWCGFERVSHARARTHAHTHANTHTHTHTHTHVAASLQCHWQGSLSLCVCVCVCVCVCFCSLPHASFSLSFHAIPPSLPPSLPASVPPSLSPSLPRIQVCVIVAASQETLLLTQTKFLIVFILNTVCSLFFQCLPVSASVLVLLCMCPHPNVYVSSYYYYMCPHATACVLILLHVSSN